ncbi:MAG: helix-turn-helix domain-containing protein [Oscillospiraceae bacterium]|nr:helix-turn-helix domain-containing protein [Oscillospiraceae bacterium]
MRGWLKEARTKKGYTLKKMGELLDISESYYSLIENSERQKNMDITLVSKISAVLGIPVGVIVAYEQSAIS